MGRLAREGDVYARGTPIYPYGYITGSENELQMPHRVRKQCATVLATRMTPN